MTTDTAKPILSLDDQRSATWRKIKAYSEGELAILRKNLEADATPERTAKLRGQIRTHILLLALGMPPTLATSEEEPE